MLGVPRTVTNTHNELVETQTVQQHAQSFIEHNEHGIPDSGK